MHVVPQSRTSLQSPTLESMCDECSSVCMHAYTGWMVNDAVLWNHAQYSHLEFYVFVVM